MNRKALLLINLVLALLMVFSSISFAFTSVPVKSITLNKTSLTLAVGKTVTLTALISPKNATNKNIIWSSSDSKIAKVNAKGVVTAVRLGKATITAKSKDGKATAKCIVTISKVEPVVELVVAIPWINLDNIDGIKNDRILNYLQDKLKIKFKLITSNEYLTKVNLIIATGETLDYLSNAYDTAFMNKLSSEGMLLNTKDLVFNNQQRYPVLFKAFNDPLYKYLNDVKFGDSENYSAIYGFSKFINTNTMGFLINGKILKETGLTVPTTIDELINLMREVKKVRPDVVPFNTALGKGTNYGTIGNQLFKPYGVRIVSLINENGVYKENFTSDAAKQAWIRVQNLYKEGLIDKEIVTREAVWQDGINSDKLAISGINCTALGQFSNYFNEYKKSHPDAKPGVDLIVTNGVLKGPAGSTASDTSPYDIGYCNGLILKSSRYPERVLDLVNYLFSNEGVNLKWWGVPGVHYTAVDASGKPVANADEIGWKKDEYFKEVSIYYKNEKVRHEWNPFSNIGLDIVSAFYFESSKDLFDAIDNCNLVLHKSYVMDDDVGKYDIKYSDLFSAQANILPFYMNNVVLSDESKTRNKKIDDVRNKWYTAFLTGEKDVNKNWGSFVKEMKDAGLNQYIVDYNDAVAKSKSTYDKYFK